MLKVNTSVIILAAGKSERFNFPKPLLPFNKEKNFLSKILDEYIQFGCSQIIIVINRNIVLSESIYLYKNFTADFKIVFNDYPELGRFFSLRLGVQSLINTDFCFLQNVDNPFVNVQLLSLIFEKKNEKDFVVPVYNGNGGHPVLLNNWILQNVLKERNLSVNLKKFLANFERFNVNTTDDKILANINTKEDYVEYFDKKLLLDINGK